MSLDAQFVAFIEGFSLEVSLSISPGRTVALLGPNGAGKSTVVDLLVGLRPIDSGRIENDGRILDDPSEGIFVAPERRSMGVVFQDYALFPHMSARDNIGFGVASRMPNREVVISEWTERMGLESVAKSKPSELSGGQAQRVALARALITQPEVLLLDEPLSAMDVTARSGLRRVLVEHLAEFEGPRLLITHDPAEAFLLADEIHVIEGGRITQVGTADDIRLRPRTSYVADLAGVNLLEGVVDNGIVTVGDHAISVVDRGLNGLVLLTIAPQAISLHTHQPDGSPRNSWMTTVTAMERLGDRVRVQTGGPVSITAEVTHDAVEALDLREASPVWVSIKATEIGVQAA